MKAHGGDTDKFKRRGRRADDSRRQFICWGAGEDGPGDALEGTARLLHRTVQALGALLDEIGRRTVGSACRSRTARTADKGSGRWALAGAARSRRRVMPAERGDAVSVYFRVNFGTSRTRHATDRELGIFMDTRNAGHPAARPALLHAGPACDGLRAGCWPCGWCGRASCPRASPQSIEFVFADIRRGNGKFHHAQRHEDRANYFITIMIRPSIMNRF